MAISVQARLPLMGTPTTSSLEILPREYVSLGDICLDDLSSLMHCVLEVTSPPRMRALMTRPAKNARWKNSLSRILGRHDWSSITSDGIQVPV